ncbi:MAG: RNA-binding protein [Steroidobacteraceae bacterium]
MTTLYVGNLPFSATDVELRNLFAQHGTVESAKVVTDRQTGRSRGFGFVDMPPADAEGAIKHLNGHEMNGRPLAVNEARERAPRPPRGGGGDRW